jgi:hypothetical protein
MYSPQTVAKYYQQSNTYNFDDYQAYTVIDSTDVRERPVDTLGVVLARCWIDPTLMLDLKRDAHACLLSMGFVLPKTFDIHVEYDSKDTNRPRIIVLEFSIETGKYERACYLQLNMIAGK